MKKTLMLFACMAALFLTALSRVDPGEQGRRRLEDTLRRTAVACYASEGFYPPDVAYMEEHWGMDYEKERYVIDYDCFASNLMPQITVLEK